MLSAFCSHSEEKGNGKWAEEEASKVQDVFFPADTATLWRFFHFITIPVSTTICCINYLFSEFVNVSSGFFFHVNHKIVSDTQFFLSFLIPWLVLWGMWYLHLIKVNMWWVWISKQPNIMQSRGNFSYLNDILLLPRFWKCNFWQDCCFSREIWGHNTLKLHL